MKYLIIKCDELGDQWECDANRTPICITDDYSKYGYGYEVYELLADNTFKLIKDYEDTIEEGFAIYEYFDDGSVNLYEKFPNMTRDDITKSQVKKWKKKYHFTDTIKDMFDDLTHYGACSDEIKGKYIVIGEYFDDNYSSGY